MTTFASMRPASGSTRRVWEIADQLTRETGQRARRKDVIRRFEEEGGNPNTASTQFQYWKSAQEEAEAPAGRPADVGPQRLTVGADGRVVIPAEMRRAMRLDDAGTVTAEVRDGELRILSSAVALERVQALLRPLKAGRAGVVDDFLAGRRAAWGEDG